MTDPTRPRLSDRLRERAFSLHAQATTAEAAGDFTTARQLHGIADQFDQIAVRLNARRTNSNGTPDVPGTGP